MNDEEFEKRSETVCGNCPLYDLEQYYERKLEKLKEETINDIVKMLKSKKMEDL